MNPEVVIVVGEDDPGHVTLIKKNLRRGGIVNRILTFKDGQQVIDFLFRSGHGPHREEGVSYLLLLDIRMPKIDGVQVLKRVKESEETKVIPTIMITTTDDPQEINRCHQLGCNTYIVKPIKYDDFMETIRQLGLFLKVVEVPNLSHKDHVGQWGSE